MEEKENNIRCPLCKSEDISDDSKYTSNHILGPGHRAWKISNVRSCNVCGIIFKPVERQMGLPKISPEEFAKSRDNINKNNY